MNKKLSMPFEVKNIAENGTFEGYGSVFHVEDSYKDVVVPGAFKASLAAWEKKGKLPALLWQHDTSKPIGVYEEMREDDHGLYVKGRLLKDEVRLASEAYALLQAGALSGLSIGYNTITEEYNRESGINTLKTIDLWETSLVTFPANEAAQVTSVKNITDFEKFLRDAGFSRSQAKRVACYGFERGQRDADTSTLKELARIAGGLYLKQ